MIQQIMKIYSDFLVSKTVFISAKCVKFIHITTLFNFYYVYEPILVT